MASDPGGRAACVCYQQIDWKPHYSAVCVRTQTIDRLMQLDLPAGVDVEVKL